MAQFVPGMNLRPPVVLERSQKNLEDIRNFQEELQKISNNLTELSELVKRGVRTNYLKYLAYNTSTIEDLQAYDEDLQEDVDQYIRGL